MERQPGVQPIKGGMEWVRRTHFARGTLERLLERLMERPLGETRHRHDTVTMKQRRRRNTLLYTYPHKMGERNSGTPLYSLLTGTCITTCYSLHSI